MVRVIDEQEIRELIDYADLLDVIEEVVIEQSRGAVERPPRPHFPVETGTSSGAGLVMPAYVHGADTFATKIVGVYEDNAEKGLPTINATILVNDAETGLPSALLAGTELTNARTGCIGGLAVRELVHDPVQLAVIGAGPQARAQTRAIVTASQVESVAVYSPSDSKHAFASDVSAELGIEVTAADSPADAVEDANVVVTVTTAREPVFDGATLAPGTLVVAIGAFSPEMRELDAETFARADAVFADVPEEVTETGDVQGADFDEDDIVPFAAVLTGTAERSTTDDIVVVESVGSAVFDQAAAEYVFDRARQQGVGEDVDL